jgi:hypothetical protein
MGCFGPFRAISAAMTTTRWFGCRLSGAKDRVAVVSISWGLSSACRPGRQGEAAWFGAKETRRPRDRETASSGADHPALLQLYEHLRSAPSAGSSNSSFGPERAPPCRPAVRSIGLVCTRQTALSLAGAHSGKRRSPARIGFPPRASASFASDTRRYRTASSQALIQHNSLRLSRSGAHNNDYAQLSLAL